MQAECKSKQIEFQGLGKRGVVGKYDDSMMTFDT